MSSVKKGILLAGGTGSRLYPLTRSINKHLLPIFDKPMIYYPLSSLMLADIREILIVTSPEARDDLESLLGDGDRFGISLSYVIQSEPKGLSDALMLGAEFVDGKSFALILGDNVFFSSGFTGLMNQIFGPEQTNRAAIISKNVRDPERFGVIEFAPDGKVLSIVEKPSSPPSNRIVSGLYRLPGDAPLRAMELRPSARGEVEITDLLCSYINQQDCLEEYGLPRGSVWFDAGTTEAINEASLFVESYQKASGSMVGAPEEIALSRGWINFDLVEKSLTKSQQSSLYFQYLRSQNA